ncbi:MAG: site-specific DNA-methyltransferase [Clostridiales bacterium]|nr:site-specific DNA-methyltransferase [Clostridiales bacterium]
MSLILKFPQIMENSYALYEAKKAAAEAVPFLCRQEIRAAGKPLPKAGEENILALGDNLDFMDHLIKDRSLAGKVQMVYIDPPFFTKANYGAEIKLNAKAGVKIPAMKQKAYKDTWENGMEDYLTMLAVRFLFIKDLLAADGCLWVHLDHHAVHYVKILLDEIFGEKNFINEVVWNYKSGGVSKRSFARKHDTLLFYAKGPKYYFKAQQEKSYNRGFKPYRFKGVKEYRDEMGWYTMVNRKDVWSLDMVGRTSSERTGYVTQKPESLVNRILESCTRPGDLCADFFCGSGTMAAAAESMGRRWIACDIGRLAAVNTHKRMVNAGASYDFYESKTEAEDTREQGTVQVKASLEALPLSDKKALKVELLGYTPATLENIPVEEKYLPVIRTVLKEDSTALVDFWSVELRSGAAESAPGGPEAAAPNSAAAAPASRPQACFCRDGKGLTLVYETLGEEFFPITVKAVDIFGNSGITVIDQPE